MTKKTESKGYLFVATLSKSYYDAMVAAIEGLKDEVPEAQVAVFTHEEWLTDQDRELFDHVFAPVPAHVRTKLWALDKTPFDVTCYMDVDIHVVDPGVHDIFDVFPDDLDIMMSENRPYNSKVVFFQDEHQNNGVSRELEHHRKEHIELYKQGKAHKFKWHCGFFIYRKNDVTDKIWSEWLRLYRLHNESEERCGIYPNSLSFWDTFAFWRVMHETNLDVKIKRVPNDAKYNFVTGYRENELKYGTKKTVLHYTIPPEIVRKEMINAPGINSAHGSFDTFR